MMEQPIRILHVVTMMDRGGLESLIMNYYKSIDRNKVQFDFLTHRKHTQAFENEIKNMGGRIYKISNLNPFSLNYRKELDEFFKQHKEYSIIHSHIDCLSYFPLYYAKKNNFPIRIAHSHSASQEKNLKYLLKLFYKNKVFSVATDYFACGDKAGNWMFNGQSFYILNNAIDTNEFKYNKEIRTKMREELNLNGKFVVTNVSSFKCAKNHLFLLDVFNDLVKVIPNSQLVLVGDGELKKKILKKINDLNLTNKVNLLGLRSDVSDILQASDLFLLPSLFEGFPVSIVEAQSIGLPCVISDGVSIECALTNNVLQIPLEDNTKIWASKIKEFMKNFVRKDQTDVIISKGYDISTNSLNLINYYYRKIKGNTNGQ